MSEATNSKVPDGRPLDPEILEPEILEPVASESSQLPPSTQSHRPPSYVINSKPFPWGCLIGGCLTVVLLMVGGIVAIGVGSVWFYNQQIAKYTSDKARPIPVVEVSDEHIGQLEARLEAFQETIEKGDTPEQMVLSAEDVNALISKNEDLRGKVFVTIEDGLVEAEVSVPVDSLPGGQGRYFNGSVSVNASLEDGVLIVTLQDAEVNGQPVPEEYMRQIRKENLAKDMYKDPDVAKRLRKFERLIIEDDKLILTPKVPAEVESQKGGSGNE